MRLHRIVRQVGLFGTALALLVGGGVFAQENSFGVTFPPLSGDYPVGMTMRTYTDESRLEIYTEDASDSRRIPVTFYYPAAPAADEVSGVYATPAEVEGFSSALGLPPFVSDAFHPNFIRDAAGQPAEGGYPILLFMPGLGTPPRFYVSLLEQVASHGYVVAVVDPVYSTALSLFPDGSYVEAVPQGLDVSTPELRDALGASWVNDARFILDTLTAVNADDTLLAGLFDLTRVGMFGHSFGGAAAFQMAHDDDRVRAAINMDGSPFGTVIAEGVGKPILYMLSEEASAASTTITDEALEAAGITREAFDAMLAEQLADRASLLESSPSAYQFVLAGSKHNTYSTDSGLARRLLPLLVPEEMVGTIEPDRAVKVISDYVVAFFDQHVKEEAVSLFDGPSADYPEVTLEVFGS